MSALENLLSLGKATTQNIDAEQFLFCLGDSCTNYVVVREGTVRVELLSQSGQQMTLYRIEAGQSCVMTTSCLFGRNEYFAQAISETPIELLLISQTVFHEELRDSSEFREFVFSGFQERMVNLMVRTSELATNTVDQRLAAAILSLAESDGSNLHLTLTHNQLAIEIGSAREVVSRRLAAFEKQGYIQKNRGHIDILDADSMQKLLTN